MAICCGDGVLHDEMSRDIILGHRLVIVGKDMSIDELWENAKAIGRQLSCLHALRYA